MGIASFRFMDLEYEVGNINTSCIMTEQLSLCRNVCTSVVAFLCLALQKFLDFPLPRALLSQKMIDPYILCGMCKQQSMNTGSKYTKFLCNVIKVIMVLSTAFFDTPCLRF